ncbi:MAG: hypothetical protein Fur007_21400 [Rhodoferax sp.]
MTVRRRLVSTWIAIAAIWLNALMPTVSLAFDVARPSVRQGNAAGGDWIEICSVQGSSWVRLDQDGQVLEQTWQKPADAPAGGHECHCPYCLTHAASFGLLPVTGLELKVQPAVVVRIPVVGPAAQPRLTWLRPAARAPPSAARVPFSVR